MIGQPQQIRDCSRLVPYCTDRTTPKPHGFGRRHKRPERNRRISRCIEKRIQVIIRKRDTTPLMKQPLATIIAAKNRNHRCLRYPRLTRDQLSQPPPNLDGPEQDNIALLQVAFGRRR